MIHMNHFFVIVICVTLHEDEDLAYCHKSRPNYSQTTQEDC